jgi:hypothetical protein
VTGAGVGMEVGAASAAGGVEVGAGVPSASDKLISSIEVGAQATILHNKSSSQPDFTDLRILLALLNFLSLLVPPGSLVDDPVCGQEPEEREW